MIRVLRLVLVTALYVMIMSNYIYAGDWQSLWLSEKRNAAERCARIFDNFQLQAVCMDNEKEGYHKMQGDFGLPSSIAYEAKIRCARIFDDFQLQAVCMKNEKVGYDKMQSYE